MVWRLPFVRCSFRPEWCWPAPPHRRSPPSSRSSRTPSSAAPRRTPPSLARTISRATTARAPQPGTERLETTGATGLCRKTERRKKRKQAARRATSRACSSAVSSAPALAGSPLIQDSSLQTFWPANVECESRAFLTAEACALMLKVLCSLERCSSLCERTPLQQHVAWLMGGDYRITIEAT